MSIVLIDSSEDSLTVSWTAADEETAKSDSTSATNSIRYYVLQYRKANDAAVAFETLSDKLTTTQARKRNLIDPEGTGYFFRVTATTKRRQQFETGNNTSKDDDGSVSLDAKTKLITHTEPFRLLTKEQSTKRLTMSSLSSPPTVTHTGTNLSAKISWKKEEVKEVNKDTAITGYELQMRENVGGKPWETIATNVNGIQVKKKNLISKNGYQFRVRPNLSDNNNNSSSSSNSNNNDREQIPFSVPSNVFVARGLSEGMKQLFGSALESGKLLRKHDQPPVTLEDGLGGKEFVLLYASAHWCGPCRNFSPQLSNWYQSLGPERTIEIIFLSADHDENSFQQYYSHMPWMAVPFDDDGRETLMGHLRVQGIPRLAVLDGKTGRIIEDNAVGKPFDMNRWRKLAAS